MTDEAAALRQTGAAPLRPADPERIGPYVPLALLGSGGMGRVYLARPSDDGPGLFAVKVIRPEYAEDPTFRRRFEHEALVHGRVRTPRAPRLCGTGFQDELLWMATEYLPALDLADAVREGGALEPGAVWRLVAELGQALADLSATGIVHRDLKPSNVLLSVSGAHVIDFGISKAADASSITGTGNRVGTPAYMSPEYLRTGHCDAASDVFSLAGTLIYAAAGRAPFGDGTGVDVMHRVAFEEPAAEVIGAITATDPALGALLSACLAKEPELRPTPAALIEAATSARRATAGTPAAEQADGDSLRGPREADSGWRAGGPVGAGGHAGGSADSGWRAGGQADPSGRADGQADSGWRAGAPADPGGGTGGSARAGGRDGVPPGSGGRGGGPLGSGGRGGVPADSDGRGGVPVDSDGRAGAPAGPSWRAGVPVDPSRSAGASAGAHGRAGSPVVASTWPEPLHARVVERQRAYDVLYRVPVARAAELRSPGHRPSPNPALPVPVPAGGAAPVLPASPAEPVGVASAETSPGQRWPAGLVGWVRRRPVPAGAVALALCALAALAVVLARPEDRAAAAPPGTVATASAGTAVEAGASSPTRENADGKSVPTTSGSGTETADGPAVPSQISGATDDDGEDAPTEPGVPTVTATGAATDGGTDSGTGATPTATPSPVVSSTEPATAPWVTECTYYAGKARTELGDSGKRVEQVQCILLKRGYDIGGTGVDGVFGAGLEAAVSSFQSDKGLAADGIVKRATWPVLRATK
ncbi:protein kinase domain-containing protein [Streptomyces sp. NBC_00075]|uniref:protein kinase domain-containing protein n=1 Tax=Streptomyces sp. NBC_00075 TaxID=2975641 RepID=UPI00387074F0